MSRFLQHYILTYTPLSPIHIGTGDSYEPTNYVIDDGTLYEFDTGGALAALTETDRTELNRIVNARANEDMLKAVQRFFYDHREKLKPFNINAIPVLEGVANLYGKRVGRAANREGDGGQVLNKLEIDRTAYNPINRQPILFGSSIKGAIRTALLDQINQGRRANERKGLHEFQGRLLQYRDPEHGKITLERDPLRLIQIGDAVWNASQNLPTTQVYLAVNRKKSPVDEKGVLRQALGENLYQILECVPAFYAQCFNGQMTIQHIELNAPNKLPPKSLRFSITEIAEACNHFYLPQLTAECELLQKWEYGEANWHKKLGDLLNLAQDMIKAGSAFLLRVGRHSGAESVTVSGARKGNIKIMKGKGHQPEYADAPKTLWLAANDPKQRSNLLPFGWLLVEIHPGGGQAIDWPELAELCAAQQGESRNWAEKQGRQKAELEEKRREAELRREREENDRRRQSELDEQAERERLAQEEELRRRKENMTAEQLQIEALKQQLQQKQAANVREQIGGPLYSAMRELINNASDWPAGDKTELLHVAKDTLKFLGAEGNKKAKELLKNLQ